jgi:uncharacterized caspase-like protein
MKEKRYAVVIGNSNYKEQPLRNPINDARDMSNTLKNLGFDVVLRENLTMKEMREEIRSFGRKIKGGGIGLFYFAGHGIQVNGRNYLIPIDAHIEKEQDVEYESVEVGRIMDEIEAAENQMNIVILDACRDNPYARSFRTMARGLATMSAPGGTIVAYATAPGSVASDGGGRNGLYTQELLNSVKLTGLKIEDVFKRVRVAVKEKSKGKQVPWETSSLESDFYFKVK